MNDHVAVVEMRAEERVEPALKSEDAEGREVVTPRWVMVWDVVAHRSRCVDGDAVGMPGRWKAIN